MDDGKMSETSRCTFRSAKPWAPGARFLSRPMQ